MSDVERLTKLIEDAETEEKRILEELKEANIDWNAKSVKHVAAAAQGINSQYEAGQTNAAQKVVQALKDKRRDAGVVVERLKQKYRNLMEVQRLAKMKDMAEEIEGIAWKVRDGLNGAESSARYLRTLCTQYQTLAGNTVDVIAELKPWTSLAINLPKLNATLPAGQVFQNRFKVQEREGFVITNAFKDGKMIHRPERAIERK